MNIQEHINLILLLIITRRDVCLKDTCITEHRKHVVYICKYTPVNTKHGQGLHNQV